VIVGGQRAWDFLSGCEALDTLAYRPDSQPTVIPDTSHDLHLDQPNQLHAVTSAFLKKSANLP
jgi:pimeloyl-ACP methyl ester carboxylesterase